MIALSLADRLEAAAAKGEQEIASFERTSAKTSADLVRLAREAASIIRVQQRELDASSDLILEMRRERKAKP
jgi:hypothetical protein